MSFSMWITQAREDTEMAETTALHELSVCIGSSCHIKGSYNVIQAFQQLIEKHNLHDDIEFRATFCMKKCRCEGVNVMLDGVEYSVKPEEAERFFLEKLAIKN